MEIYLVDNKGANGGQFQEYLVEFCVSCESYLYKLVPMIIKL